MHALIIENHFFVATLIESELRDLGYFSVHIVDSGDEAVHSAARQRPDLVTADQRLATGSGVEAIRVICEARPIPVIFISGYGDEVQKLLPDAVVLSKPFAPRLLRAAIGEAILRTRRNSEPAD